MIIHDLPELEDPTSNNQKHANHHIEHIVKDVVHYPIQIHIQAVHGHNLLNTRFFLIDNIAHEHWRKKVREERVLEAAKVWEEKGGRRRRGKESEGERRREKKRGLPGSN